MNVALKIKGLSCGHCVKAVENILGDLEGVKQYTVSLPDEATVEFDENIINIEKIKQTINDSEIYKAL
ncbi:MAG: cation transporter [Flavobacteriales bacterium]|nr:cation transporter [Flavobacteriales bacterium]MCW8913592.1 cation transporter [Flavobacteriales bacterium]MCW8938661.1 cation transporter [Flavobacteriales bacterium]MCW8940194.1 cation transporter [Flavobacteriales bacterium]MCW8967852.1 cation transporter [Flavobacteriales bacterium]